MQGSVPAVTVVVPVWDSHVQYLAEGLSTLLAQVPAPRVIVVDNCSTVAVTVPEAVTLARTPARLSTGAARSFGLGLVVTELVMFWDADDLMPAGTLVRLRARITADPRLVLVAAEIVESDGLAHRWPRRRLTRALARWPLLLATVSAISSLVPGVGALMDTATARAAGGFPDLDASDDWVLAVAIALRGRVEVIPQVGRVYRRHGHSLSAAHQGVGDRLAHARAVRQRIAVDPAAPRALRRGLGPLAVAQAAVIFGLAPLAGIRRR